MWKVLTLLSASFAGSLTVEVWLGERTGLEALMASVPPWMGPLLDSTVVAMERRNIMRGAMREVAILNDMVVVGCVRGVEIRRCRRPEHNEGKQKSRRRRCTGLPQDGLPWTCSTDLANQREPDDSIAQSLPACRCLCRGSRAAPSRSPPISDEMHFVCSSRPPPDHLSTKLGFK